MEDVVEPHLRLIIFPRDGLSVFVFLVPREVEVAFPGSRAETDGAHAIFLEYRKILLEGRDRAAHIFGADHRTAVLEQILDCFFGLLGPIVAMEGNDVAVFQYEARLGEGFHPSARQPDVR